GKTKLRRPARRVGLPEGDLPRLPGCGRDEDLRRGDVGESPGRGAKHERLADAALVHHLLIELPNQPTVADEVHAVEPAVRDRTRVYHRQPLRSWSSANGSGDAIPHHSRPQLRELVRWIATAEHVEHRFERAGPKLAERICATHQG